MDAGLDTGPVLVHRALPIEPTATGQTLEEALAKLGAELLLEVLEQLGDNSSMPNGLLGGRRRGETLNG